MASQHVLVFGGTGLIGEHITKALVDAAPAIGRISLFTSQNTIWTKSDYIDSLKKQGVSVISGDLKSRSDVDEAYAGVDIVVSCVGRQVIDKQIDLIKWADEHPDVKHFFPSEYGTDIEYNADSANERPHQMKLKVRAALAQTKQLSHTYVVTGPYGDADPGLYLSAVKPEWQSIGTFDVARRTAVLIGNGTGQISLTTMRDCGKLVAAAVAHIESVKDKALKVNSFTTTPAEIVAEFERQTGVKWDISHVSLAELQALEAEAWSSGSPMATAATLRRIWAQGGTLYAERDNDQIGMEDAVDDLKTAIAQAIKVQAELQQ